MVYIFSEMIKGNPRRATVLSVRSTNDLVLSEPVEITDDPINVELPFLCNMSKLIFCKRSRKRYESVI